MSTTHPPKASQAAAQDDIEYAATPPPTQAPHVTVRGYLTGYLLAVALTVAAFWIAMSGVVESSTTAGLILIGLGIVQIFVHMVYFLHMNPRSEGGWNLIALIFTAVLLVIVLIGTLWVMHHMNGNMMPATHDMQRMQDMQ